MADPSPRLVQVDGDDTKAEFEWLQGVLVWCYGPWGAQALLHSRDGGVVTCTKRALKLYQLLRTSNPLLRNAMLYLQGHAQCYRDSALYAGMLTCNLILCGLKLQMPRRRVAMVINHTLSLVEEWLNSDACPVSRQLDMGSAQELVALLVSYLGPKANVLSQRSLQHLSTLILKAFLRAVPSDGEGIVNILEHMYLLPAPPIGPTHLSSLREGLLLPQDMCCLPVQCDSFQQLRRRGHTVVTALFDASLAGDVAEGSEFKLVGLAGTSVDDVYVEQLLNMGRGLVDKGVGLVGCQKCIHPLLQDFLHQEGIVVLERLSSLLFGPVHKLCGGEVLSTPFLHSITQASLGKLAAVKPLLISDNWYVQLLGVGDSHSTLVCCCESERQLEELQPLVQDAAVVLEHCAGRPRVLCGGGCADTSIAHHIRTKAHDCPLPPQVGRVDCTTVMEMVADCFERMACGLGGHGAAMLTDSHAHHCWVSPSPDAPPPDAPPRGHTPEDSTCGCGEVPLSAVPPDSCWSRIDRGPLHVPTLGVSVPRPLLSAPQHQEGDRVIDLLTPRIAALSCANGLADMVLTTAFVLTQQH